MADPITWTNKTRRLSQLIPWPRNPRQIKAREVERLQESLQEFGQVEPVCIGPANELYNGHQRLKSWAAKYGDIEIDVRISSRPLTDKEREKLTVYLHKGAAGEWDFDVLSEWDIPDLMEWGFSEQELDLDMDIPEVTNEIEANTTKAGQYDKTKMPVNVGALLLFLSPDEQEEFSENFDVFYEKSINEDENVALLVKQTVGRLADEIRALISAD